MFHRGKGMGASGPSRVLVMASTFPRFAGDSTPPFVLRLCQAMQVAGWESVVLAPHARGLARAEVLEGVACRRFRYAPEGMERLAYGGGMLANVRSQRWLWLVLPFYLLGLLLAATRVVLGERIEVVHAHWVIPQGFVAVLLKKLLFWRDLRVVLTAHGSDMNSLGGLAGRLLRWTMCEADALAVVSEPLRQDALALGVPADKIVVAPMGVDTRRFCPPTEAAAREDLLFVGRLVPEKGVSCLLQAFARVAIRRPGLRLRIVGNGPLRAGLEAEAVALGLAGRVQFLGAKAPVEVPAFFQSAQLFVLPSLQEGLGLVVAEALACGCPVVAHDLPAVRALVHHGESGLMVPAGDTAALAAAIERLLANPGEAAALAAAGRQHVLAKFDWTAVARRYRCIYEGPGRS